LKVPFVPCDHVFLADYRIGYPKLPYTQADASYCAIPSRLIKQPDGSDIGLPAAPVGRLCVFKPAIALYEEAPTNPCSAYIACENNTEKCKKDKLSNPGTAKILEK